MGALASIFEWARLKLLWLLDCIWSSLMPAVRPIRSFLGVSETYLIEEARKKFKDEMNELLQDDPGFLGMGYKEAVKKCSDDTKLLLAYFHAPRHSETKPYLRNIIASNQFKQILENEIYLWGASIEQLEGYRLLSALHLVSFPCLAILKPVRSGNNFKVRLLAKIYGNNINQIIAEINRVKQHESMALQEELARRMQDEERRRLVEEQNQAYDIARVEDRKKQEERREKEKQETRITELEEKFKAENNGVVNPYTIRIQLPQGTKVQRDFAGEASFEEVWDFAEYSLGKSVRNCELRLNFPKKIFKYAGRSERIQDLGLGKKAMLYLQDLDN